MRVHYSVEYKDEKGNRFMVLAYAEEYSDVERFFSERYTSYKIGNAYQYDILKALSTGKPTIIKI